MAQYLSGSIRRDYSRLCPGAWAFSGSASPAVAAFMIIGGTFALFAAKSRPVRYLRCRRTAAVYADAIEGRVRA